MEQAREPVSLVRGSKSNPLDAVWNMAMAMISAETTVAHRDTPDPRSDDSQTSDFGSRDTPDQRCDHSQMLDAIDHN